jgi:hypothetical protein
MPFRVKGTGQKIKNEKKPRYQTLAAKYQAKNYQI